MEEASEAGREGATPPGEKKAPAGAAATVPAREATTHTDTRKERAYGVFKTALAFAERTHPADVSWIRSRVKPVSSFEDFFEEYIYVVCASGFRAQQASLLTPKLYECKGDRDAMLKIFKNKKKVESIAKVYNKYSDNQEALEELVSRGEEGLIELPFIGKTTVKHLARNIGVERVAKPDLHMLRFSEANGFGSGPEAVRRMVEWFADRIAGEGRTDVDVGTADFVLWLYLMHQGRERGGCCHGGLRLR